MKIFLKTFKALLLIIAVAAFSARATNTHLLTNNGTGYKAADIDTAVYVVVDAQPLPHGGPEALVSYLAKNLKYPSVDRENKVSGRVYLTFIVEADGRLSHFNAIRSPSETLKAEAIRVLASSPRWTPGQLGGKSVRVQYTLPINFEFPK